MKKWLVIGSIVLVLGLLIVGFAAPIFAHSPDDGEATTSSGVYLDQPTLTRLAQVLGLTPDELAARLQEGKTLSEIAVEQNVPEEEVVTAILAPYQKELELQVEFGYITQEQADALMEEAENHARTLLNQDLSSPEGYGGSYWEEMGNYCGGMMGYWDGSQTGWGGMMGNGWGGMMGNGWGGSRYGSGGMMGNGWGGSQYGSGGLQSGWGGLMRGWADSITRGLGNMMGNGWGGSQYGSGGMMGW